MRYRIFALFALLLSAAPAAYAQEGALQKTDDQKPTLQQRLMPEAVTATLLAPAAIDVRETREIQPAQPANMASGPGVGLMIAGAGLFVAGLIVGDDAGTVLAVAGAGIGAYGLYLYFR
jgi:hypothetical protein